MKARPARQSPARLSASRQLATITAIQRAIAYERDFQAIIDASGNALRETYGPGGVRIHWWDEATRSMHVPYAYEEGQRLQISPMPLEPGGAIERFLCERRVWTANSPREHDAPGLPHLLGHAVASGAIAVPLLTGDRIVGAITVADVGHERAFGKADERLLTTIATSLALALDRTRLFNETQDALSRQTATADILRVISSSPSDVQPVFDAIVQNARRLCAADSAGVLTYDGALLRIESLHNDDAERTAALRRAYPPPANRGGASRRAIPPSDVMPVLEAVVERAKRICDSRDAHILLVDGETLRFAAGDGDVEAPERGALLPLTRGLVTGRAVIDRLPVHVDDLTAEEAEFPEGAEISRKYGHRTTLGVPLLREQRSLGEILLRRGGERPKNGKQIALLNTLPDQPAVPKAMVRIFKATKYA